MTSPTPNSNDPLSASAAPGPLNWWVRGIVMVGLVVVFGLFSWFLPVQDYVFVAMEWFRTAGPVGWLGFAALYVVVTMALLPTSLMTMGGGFLFGPFVGFGVVWISENLAAFLCFLVGRYVARPWVRAFVDARPVLKALDTAMGEQGFRLLVLIRHSPLVPFGILNYSMAVTSIRPQTYVGATLTGTFVPAFAYCYLGSTFTRLDDVLAGDTGDGGVQSALYWGGLVATLFATIAVSIYTRRALTESLPDVA